MQEEKTKSDKLDGKVLQQIKKQVEQIRYGSVTIVIHDGRVIQLDTNEKIRLA